MINGKMLFTAMLCLSGTMAYGGVLTGKVRDKVMKESIVGATVMTADRRWGVITDLDGNFSLTLPNGSYDIVVSCIGFETMEWKGLTVKGEERLDIEMEETVSELGEVIMSAVKLSNTETAVLHEQKESNVAQTAVSAAQISKTQDKDAGEVIRRVPGVSIIDNKFVMVHGLSQRYNNVWINGGAVPSSEADSRAFSFDIIPAGQIDNMTITKSPAPEYPADFSGGFITIATRQTVTERKMALGFGVGYNDESTFRSFSGLHRYQSKSEMLRSGIINDWVPRDMKALPSIKLNGNYADSWRMGDYELGVTSTINFSTGQQRMMDMENSLYGPYDISNDRPVYLRRAIDNQYTTNRQFGTMMNLSLSSPAKGSRYEWNNLLSIIGKDRYSERWGVNAQPDSINNMEYFHSSRLTYNTQLRGKHLMGASSVDWIVSYSYANRNLPDRRLIERTDRTDYTMGIYRISREFTRLDEHIASASANYQQHISDGLSLKTGVYGEYRTREYRTRQFQYGWNPENSLPAGWLFDDDIQGNILRPENYAPNRLYLYEEVNFMNNYQATQAQGAGYVAADIRWERLKVYAGVRYEYVHQVLGLNTRQFEESRKNSIYTYSDLFPSINFAYAFNDKHQLRLAYGRSVNRPEFRELSPSVYYDFDLGSSVMGNYDLKEAMVDNVDLRWEWYPRSGELISIALFYKHFSYPIEWTYTIAGGTDLVYSYINAHGANNYGIEVDMRKNLDFIGMPRLSMSLNVSLINSKVQFAEGSNDIDRPMQGQSPYIVNAGFFYQHDKKGVTAALMYNVIGKRIIGVGNRYGAAADGTSRNIPNSYEMPRHQVDLTMGKRLGYWQLTAAVRDLLAQPVVFQQMEEIVSAGHKHTVKEVNRKYHPGRNFNITIGYNF